MSVPAKLPLRLFAFLIHLAVSAGVVAAVAALMFGLWYPGPLRQLAGGVTLFLLIASVDVVLGPLLTLLLANGRKSRRELGLDLSVVALLQVAALAYGVWTMASARPVWLAFEVDLFRVVTAAEVDRTQLGDAPADLRRLSWTGPRLIGTRRPPGGQEQLDAILLGMNGVHLAMQPRYWLPYELQRSAALARARPVAALAPAVQQRLADTLVPWPQARALPLPSLRWLPVLAARASGTLLLDDSGQPVAFAPLDLG